MYKYNECINLYKTKVKQTEIIDEVSWIKSNIAWVHERIFDSKLNVCRLVQRTMTDGAVRLSEWDLPTSEQQTMIDLLQGLCCWNHH